MSDSNPRPELGEYKDAISHPASKAALALRRRMRPRTRLLHGIQRVRVRWMLIVQATLAAGIAYWFAVSVLGHINPFFAPMAALLGVNVMAVGPRLKFSLELTIGAALGVGVGDFIISLLGPGFWQLTVGVLFAMVIGVFVGRGPLVVNQAASSAILIATIIPPGSSGSYNRMTDALVGGLIGVFVMAVLPRNPVPAARRKVATVLDLGADILFDVAEGMQARDTDRIRAALQVGRSSQAEVSLMDQTVADAAEQVKVSPLLWRRKDQLSSLSRVVHPTDNALRNIRILARRAIVAQEDHVEFSPELVELVAGVSEAARSVRRLIDDHPTLSAIPTWGELPYEPGADDAPDAADQPRKYEDVLRQLRRHAAKMRPEIVADATLSETVVFAQCRSLMVDLLQVCGLSRLSAVATLPPTTPHPAMPPEVWDE